MAHKAMLAVAALTLVVAAPAHALTPAAPGNVRPPVIAVVGDAGLNPLHAEFATSDGRDPTYPAGMPRPVRVALPTTGSFAERLSELRRGPLGSPRPGTLYAVGGTRLLVYAPPGTDTVLDDRAHGTGVVASAAGSRTGTAKDALVVFVAGTSADGYDWIADQPWIDVATTSVYAVRSTDQCAGAAGVRRLYSRGGLMFSSSGNTQDVAEPASIPNGLPEVYQVGGVDSAGKTWLPPHPEQEQPAFVAANVVRPYETGARFSFPSASGDSLTAMQPFGGTSGATPTVAGYAAELIANARRLTNSKGARKGQVLASAPAGTRLPARGPLADGKFTRDELVDVLHRAAIPAEDPSPLRYAIEGYGASDERAFRRALAVLEGKTALPDRQAEDAANKDAESARAFLTARC